MPPMSAAPGSQLPVFSSFPAARIRYNRIRVRTALIWLLVLVCASAADIPMTLVSDNEAEPIHSAIVRREAWTLDSVRRLRIEAEKRMKEGPWTVTSDRPKI